jgi:hypothetical protein
LPKSISRGRRRCNQEQEKVFHEYAGGPFRVEEVGGLEGAERRRLGLLKNSGVQGSSIKVELSQGTELNSFLATGWRTVLAKGTVTANVDMEDEEVIFEMEKGPRMRPPPPPPQPKYRSR